MHALIQAGQQERGVRLMGGDYDWQWKQTKFRTLVRNRMSNPVDGVDLITAELAAVTCSRLT